MMLLSFWVVGGVFRDRGNLRRERRNEKSRFDAKRLSHFATRPKARAVHRRRVEARDDCDHVYGRLAHSSGVAGLRGHTVTIGAFSMPLPQPEAALLRVRMSWSKDSSSLWEVPAHEFRIAL
jgi:hypothetical protein